MDTNAMDTNAMDTNAMDTNAMDTNAMDTNAMNTTNLPARFPITSNDATNSLQHIYNVTNKCAGINTAFIAQMGENIIKRKTTWFGSVEAPEDSLVIKHIIGKNGFHLKKFTSKYGVDFIWHDRTSNIFMVWGNKKCLIGALYALKRQIARFVLKREKDLEQIEKILTNLGVTRIREENDPLDEPLSKRMKTSC